MVTTWPIWGVSKRTIRKVHSAHVQTSARLSQLISRDERGSLPDEVGSPTQEEEGGCPRRMQKGEKCFDGEYRTQNVG
jgi:hypothetical protein